VLASYLYCFGDGLGGAGRHFLKPNFNNIFKDKIINKLFYINNPSVSLKKQNKPV
jgi:hypothetical protein